MKTIEIDVAARVLGTSVAQVRHLCAVLGARVVYEGGSDRIERAALDRMYATLYANSDIQRAA